MVYSLCIYIGRSSIAFCEINYSLAKKFDLGWENAHNHHVLNLRFLARYLSSLGCVHSHLKCQPLGTLPLPPSDIRTCCSFLWMAGRETWQPPLAFPPPLVSAGIKPAVTNVVFGGLLRVIAEGGGGSCWMLDLIFLKLLFNSIY